MENKMIFKKIIAILQEIEAIGKKQKNKQQGYNFRGIDDMYNSLHPLFAKHGVFIMPEKVLSEREERKSKQGGVLIYSIMDYKFTFYAEDGSSVSAIITGEAMDSGDKASNKAVSAAMKYVLMQVFLIPTDELIDGDIETPEPISKIQKNKKELWLKPGTKEWEIAINYLKYGYEDKEGNSKKGTIYHITTKYKLTAENKKKLITESNEK